MNGLVIVTSPITPYERAEILGRLLKFAEFSREVSTVH